MFKDKIVLVTGANKGIGRAIAQEFKNKNAKVIATARKDSDIQNLDRDGFISLYLDVSDDNSINNMYKKIGEMNIYPDILINNAGTTEMALIQSTSDASWDNIINTNLRSTFKLSKLFAKNMSKKRFGRIISISSVLASMPQKGFSCYSASKAAIESFTRIAALEYAKKGVTFNCVAPGFVDTDMLNVLGNKGNEILSSQIPVGYMATPEDIAELVIYLAQARYITGETVHINGGLNFK